MNQKQLVGEKAATFVEDGMVVGLGTGSTAVYMVQALAERVKNEKLSIVCVSTSKATEKLALSLGLNMKPLAEVNKIDLTIDGADEISPDFHGIKGGGGALLYEKIVATNSKKNLWIVDDSKLVNTLGKFPLPVEVVPFGCEHLFEKFKEKGYRPEYRKDEEGAKFITDSDHFIIDLYLEKIEDPKAFANELKNEVGVVEHGLFIDIVDQVIAGTPDGKIEIETK
ncbi:MAG TPA: ribose-5-phosphate isomerase RpiA [Candidatus Atopostipes pullistercoris]|uniref:Ribose-5-phosphate isomerase A n=1 Tax=Candidatus Atopostipes pullistercoris TaxID=2838467 RepID=A0A9D2G3U7_9LACT|nr:ribose-5-phosphate isomerase RpiA [Candidatus Atopostipes pullistercoris]